MNEDRRSVYTAVTTHMVLLKVKDGLIISYALELGHRGQGGDAVQATLCPETPARITVISGGRGGGGGGGTCSPSFTSELIIV